jgi:hypothetical protein
MLFTVYLHERGNISEEHPYVMLSAVKHLIVLG